MTVLYNVVNLRIFLENFDRRTDVILFPMKFKLNLVKDA